MHRGGQGLQRTRGLVQQPGSGRVSGLVLEHERRETGITGLAGMCAKFEQGLACRTGLPPDGLHQRPRLCAVVVGGMRQLHGLLAEPGTTAFVADLPAPATGHAPAAVRQQRLGDRARARDQQCARLTAMRPEQRGEPVGDEAEAGHAGIGSHKGLKLRADTRAGEAKPQGAVLQQQARHLGTRDRVGDMPPGLFGALPQRRRARLTTAEDAPLGVGHQGPGAGTATIDADPPACRPARIAVSHQGGIENWRHGRRESVDTTLIPTPQGVNWF
mmetsp:Transcript_61161/g.144463  ORF Transcript_61161/g.144463 Transcript_61161/m.144463 type:complete len:273 (-) Transcript_61161:1056-1874(-)